MADGPGPFDGPDGPDGPLGLGDCMVQGHLYFGVDHPTLSVSGVLKTNLGPKAAKHWLQPGISVQMCYFNSRRLYMGSVEQ